MKKVFLFIVFISTINMSFTINLPFQIPETFKKSFQSENKNSSPTSISINNKKEYYLSDFSFNSFQNYFHSLSKKENDSLKKDLEFTLNFSSIAFYSKNFKKAHKSLEIADNAINRYEERLMTQKLSEELLSLLLNDLIKNYNPLIYERVFVNIYKAIIYLKNGRLDLANVELNRAIERLKYANTVFKKEVSILEQEVDKHTKGKVKLSDKTIPELEKFYTNLDIYKNYKDFQNPFVYYLKGILYYIDRDFQNAQDMFKIAYGLIRGSEKGAKEVNKVWKWAKSKRKGNFVWIFIFNGLTFKKVEKRVDLPLLLFTSKLYYFGFALPDLKERPIGSNSIAVFYKGKMYTPLRLVNVDRLYAWEFKQRLKSLILKELLRTSVKTITQITLKEKLGPLGGFIGGTTQFLTTKADTRQWYYLPKQIEVLALKVKQGEKVTIHINRDKIPFHIKGKHTFIFIHVFPKGEVISEKFEL